MKTYRVEVRDRHSDIKNSFLARQAREFLHLPVEAIETQSLYFVEGAFADENRFTTAAMDVFVDPVLQKGLFVKDTDFRIEHGGKPAFVCVVRFLPGVTDNIGRSATEAFLLLAPEAGARVGSGQILLVYGDVSAMQAEFMAYELVANKLLHDCHVYAWDEYTNRDRFGEAKFAEVQLQGEVHVGSYDLNVSDAELEKMSQQNCWALTLDEMLVIRDFFNRDDVQQARQAEGLGKNPTDVEMEVLAQTWSEHCKHKIFNAAIEYDESYQDDYYPQLGKTKINSLFKDKIRQATLTAEKEHKLDWLISVFTDNAGIVRFDDKIDLCIKVETHNSPSALDPYGGALTGIVGVNRDILGCGLGARPIANTDVFCFAAPEWPPIEDKQALPVGLKHPRRIFDGVHLGVEHGGNKSGIPTVNGAIVFHENYAGKPLVFCGTVGAMPQKTASGVETSSKNQQPGDHVVMVGGRIGKDGIHGATFSSMELDEGAPATVVQIGDPITQKRASDFLLKALELELFSSLTDNGAGGLSSSIGEMAEGTGGATIDVARAPMKYPGLQPFELTVSESQERMSFSVPADKLDAFMKLAGQYNVEATDLGTFTDDGYFRVQYEGKTVAALPMDFLHDGLPKMELKANWHGPTEPVAWADTGEKDPIAIEEANDADVIYDAVFRVLGSWNVRSKERWVRRYDHEVQAATLMKPFTGKEQGPGDAAVVWLAPHGGSEQVGITVSCGLVPRMAYYDAYLMAQHSLDEAVRNTIAVGGDPAHLCVLDNFCWPDPIQTDKNPDGDHKLAQLVRACAGLYDMAVQYGTPFVSGKDSMKNDFKGKMPDGREVKISVPPTVLVTAMAKVPDVSKTVSSEFKNVGDRLYLLGQTQKAMAASELAELFELEEFAMLPPTIDITSNKDLYRHVFQANQRELLASCHDLSDGGLAVALIESAIGSGLGARITLDSSLTVLEHLFNEASGRFLVSVAAGKEKAFNDLFGNAVCMGEVTGEKSVEIVYEGATVFSETVATLDKCWRGSHGNA